MAIEADLRLWTTIVGWLVLVFGGGAAWGNHRGQLKQHQKELDALDPTKIMTENKCKEFHKAHQEPVDIKLTAIQATLEEMKSDRKETDQRLGVLTSKLDILVDRMERRDKQQLNNSMSRQ